MYTGLEGFLVAVHERQPDLVDRDRHSGRIVRRRDPRSVGDHGGVAADFVHLLVGCPAGTGHHGRHLHRRGLRRCTLGHSAQYSGRPGGGGVGVRRLPAGEDGTCRSGHGPLHDRSGYRQLLRHCRPRPVRPADRATGAGVPAARLLPACLHGIVPRRQPVRGQHAQGADRRVHRHRRRHGRHGHRNRPGPHDVRFDRDARRHSFRRRDDRHVRHLGSADAAAD